MDQKLIFRTATIEDKESIFQLANQLSDLIQIDENIFTVNFNEIISDKNHFLMIADLEEKVVGYLSGYFHKAIYANGLVAYVDEIVVRDNQRRLKIGTLLMKELEFFAKSKNCKLISLATGGARGFYEKIGYESKAGYYKKYL
jgi:GNAT superfamily N-acetyltransferase